MSQTKYPLPRDISRIAIEIVRGYDRRVQMYHEARHCILNGQPCNFVTYIATIRHRDGRITRETRRQYFPHGSAISDSTLDKALRLEALESDVETVRMRAVEEAKLQIGLDILNEPERQKLITAIWDSCIEGRNFTLIYRNLCVGKDNFYERRRKFLFEIAKKTGFI